MTQDRRKIPRVPVAFTLENLSRTADVYQEECQGVVKNITPNGLLLETATALKKNELLQLSFTLPSTKRTLNLESRVCWIESDKSGTKAGLEFMDLSMEQREAIVDYLLTLGISL